MIKAAFFDIDGTLFSYTKHEIPESTKKALRILKEKGIKVFLASGRGIQSIKLIDWCNLAFDGYVTLNGQICLDAEQNLIYGAPIQGEDAEFLFDAFVNKKIPLAIVEKDRIYLNYIDDNVRKAQAAVAIKMHAIEEYKGAPVYQFIGYMGREETAEFAKNIPNCKITRWFEQGIDIISKDGGKAKGIEKILETCGFTREETIAFGDSDNDVDMLEFVGIGVAMGNATNMVKERADYVTDHIDENGLWNALRHFEII